jgi:hypothetical protein
MEKTALGQVKAWLTDAAMLAALSVFGYTLAYLYEVGFANHFGYPSYLISPTPPVIAGALVVLSLGAQILALLGVLWSDLKEPEWKDVALNIAMLWCFAIIMLIQSDSTLKTVAVVVAVFAVTAFLTVTSRETRRIRGNHPAGPGMLQRFKTNMVVTGISGLIATGLAAQVVGELVAKSQQTFFLLDAKTNFAVVRIYGDVVVAAKMNMATEQFTGEYFVGKLGSDDLKLHLKRETFPKARPRVFPSTEPAR